MNAEPHPPATAMSLSASAPAALIDLNDVWAPLPARHDLAEVRRRLADTAPDWLPALFPQAVRSPDRKTLRCADLSGRRPRGEGSCVLHLEGRFAGWGFDHATGESAGPIDMVYHATGLTEVRLFAEAARLAHMEQPAHSPRPQEPRPDHSREVARLLEGCQPLAGTVAETYLRSRGLAVPDSPDLLFHPDLTDFDTKRGWAGMVALVRDGAGEPTGGIHRTYLLDDGSAKAPPSKKMLGPVAGGAVALAPMPENGRIGVAEGIETALSAQAIFAMPTMAALSADGQWDIDKTRRRLTETADPTRSPLASGASADGTPFARLKVAQLALKVEAQRLSLDETKRRLLDVTEANAALDEIGSTMRDALLNWPARVSGLIAAEISVDPHLLQTILQSHINDLLTEAADRFDPAGLGGDRSSQP